MTNTPPPIYINKPVRELAMKQLVKLGSVIDSQHCLRESWRNECPLCGPFFQLRDAIAAAQDFPQDKTNPQP